MWLSWVILPQGLMRLQSRFWLGLQLSEGLMGTQGSTPKLTGMAVIKRPWFLAVWTSLHVIVVSFSRGSNARERAKQEVGSHSHL